MGLPGEEGAGVGLLEAYLRRQRELHARYRGRVEEADSIARRLASRVAGAPAIVARVAASSSSIEADMPPRSLAPHSLKPAGSPRRGLLLPGGRPENQEHNPSPRYGCGEAPPPRAEGAAPRPPGEAHPLTVASNVSPVRLQLSPILSIHLTEREVEGLASGSLDPAELMASLEPTSTTPPPDPGAPWWYRHHPFLQRCWPEGRCYRWGASCRR